MNQEEEDRVRELLITYIGEGVHTGLRKWCESEESHKAWLAIRDMPGEEWLNIATEIANLILSIKGLKEGLELYSIFKEIPQLVSQLVLLSTEEQEAIRNGSKICVKADDQKPPEFITASGISEMELVEATRQSMTTPDKEGNVWVKVIGKNTK